MKKLIISFCIIFYSATLFAQQGVFKLFPGGTTNKIIQTKDGNFITAIVLGTYIKLIKLDPNADTIWTKCYIDNPTYPYVMDIIESSDSSIVISGLSTQIQGNPFVHDIFFLKMDKDGNVQSYKILNIPDAQQYYKVTIQEAWNGGYVMAVGCTLTTSESEILFMKLDSNGSVLFANMYNNPFAGKLVFDMIKAPDSTYIIGGAISGFTGDNLLIGKLNKFGQPVWWNSMDDPFTGAAVFKILNTFDNGILLTGFDFNAPSLVKLDSLRNVEFAYSYRPNSTNFNVLAMPASTVQMPDSGYTIYCTGNANIFLIRTDKHGDTLWTRSYGTEFTDYTSDFYFYFQGSMLLSNNNFVFTCNVTDDSTGNFYSMVSMIDTSGELCNQQQNGCTVSSCNYTSTSANFSPVSVIYYENSLSIITWQDGISDSLICTLTSMPEVFPEKSSLSVFPNPFIDDITVQIKPGISGLNHLKIYNSYGVKCFEKFDIDNTSIIDLHKLIPGLYFLEYEIGDRKFSKKIIKL